MTEQRNAWRVRLGAEYRKLAVRAARPVTQAIDALMWNHYRQVEALTSLYGTLDIRIPLPSMRGWAVSPDFAREVARLVVEVKPRTIAELGSGVSTVIAAYALRSNGGGRIVSLEHDQEWFAKTARLIDEHGLTDIAEVVHAPLTRHTIAGADWRWYETRGVDGMGPVDLLVVDGPPCSLQPLARYPALPLLVGLLSDTAVIVLDDTNRPDERETVVRWEREYGPFTVEAPLTEKGCAILRRRS